MLSALLLTFAMSTRGSGDFRNWGFETLNQIQSELSFGETHLYGEEAHVGKPPKAFAYNWGVGVMLQALNAAAKIDPKFQSRLESFVEASHRYWNPAPPVAGYDVLPMPRKPDRYYDDNQWMVLALVDASQILKSPKILRYARDSYAFVASGEDQKLGGGIYWRESDRASKNTCSNAPAAAAALALFGATKEPPYLEDAKRLYQWTRSHLRDPQDGLYWDGMSLSGKIEKTKWTYNSGLMLRDAAELYSLTREPRYADDAREILSSSLNRWVNSAGFLTDEGKFFHLLLENWLLAYRLVPEAKDPRPAIEKGLELLHEKSRDSLGHYGSRWDSVPPAGGYPTFALIDQASVARAYLQAWTELH